MKYILLLLFSFTLQAQSLLLLFDDEADSTTTLPPAVWSQDPTLQMFPGGMTVGSELVPDPTFSTDYMTKGTGWSWNAGGYYEKTAGTAASLTAASVLPADYDLSAFIFEFDAVVIEGQASTVQSGLALMGSTFGLGIAITETGHYKVLVKPLYATANRDAGIYGFADFVGRIDNLSIKRVNFVYRPYVADALTNMVEGANVITNPGFTNDTDWTKGDGWSISGDKASLTANTGSLTQNALTVGRPYKMQYQIPDDPTANLNPIFGTTIRTGSSQGGGMIYRYYNFGYCTDNGNAGITPASSTSGSVDNIYYYEVPGTPGYMYGGMEFVNPGSTSTGIEKGFIFDGVNDYIAVPCTTSTTVSTLSAWVKFTTTGAERYIFGTTTGYVRKSSSEIIQASSGTIYLDGQPYSGSAITAGWHQITVTGIALSGTTLNVGASITPGSYLAGFIDRAGRFNGTLSANQVLKLYNDQKSRYGL